MNDFIIVISFVPFLSKTTMTKKGPTAIKVRNWMEFLLLMNQASMDL